MKRPVATGDGGPTQNAKRAKRAQEPSDAGKFTDVSALRALSDLLGEPMTAAEPAAAPPRKRERGKKKKGTLPQRARRCVALSHCSSVGAMTCTAVACCF